MNETIGVIAFTVIIMICTLGMVFCLIELYRNKQVHAYRTNLIELISIAAKDDIKRGLNYKWRYNTLESVEYQTMVVKFWKTLDSFYPNKSFIRIGSDDPEGPEKL